MNRSPNWTERRSTERGNTAHGITFVMQERRTANTRGEAAVNDRKLHLDGVASLTLALDQRQYGDELKAEIVGDGDHVARMRVDDSHKRVQVFLGPVDLDTAEMLERVARHIRARVASRQAVAP